MSIIVVQNNPDVVQNSLLRGRGGWLIIEYKIIIQRDGGILMKKIISLLTVITIWVSAFSPAIVYGQENVDEKTEQLWDFNQESGFSVTPGDLDMPVIPDQSFYDNAVGAVKSHSGAAVELSFSQPIEVSLNDKVTIEADIAYSKENGKHMEYAVSSSTGNKDLLYSNLSAYSATKTTSLKLTGQEQLTPKEDGTYGRPGAVYNPGSTADTAGGWTHYKAVFDYNAQLMTLVISSAKGTDEYAAPLSYETDISSLRFVSSNSSGRPCYIDNISIKKENSDIPFTPGEKVHSIVREAEGDITVVDTSSLYRDSHVQQFRVTTADGARRKVAQSVVDAANQISVNTAGAAKLEITPVYRYEDIGSLAVEKTIRTGIEDGLYDFKCKKAGKERADIYINGTMAANNVDKTGYGRTISSGAEIELHDIMISGGAVKLAMTDTNTPDLSWCEFVKASSIVKRATKIFVLGDSLVANYYGTPTDQYTSQAGWGEVLSSYFTADAEVVNLANGGHYAQILLETAFPGVLANGQSGDYIIIESGYNDVKYNTMEETREYVEQMSRQAKEKGIVPVIVSPNASMNNADGTDDYAESVRYTQAMKRAAENTEAYYIDLSQKSYQFYHNTYGDDRKTITNTYYFSNDSLHHNYLGAMKCAEIVAQGLYDAGIRQFVNTGFSFTFTDVAGNELVCKVREDSVATPAPIPSAPAPTASSEPVSVELNGKVRVQNGVYHITATAVQGTRGTVAAALYKDGALIAVKSAALLQESATFETVPAKEPDQIKLMLWDGFDAMNPQCSATVLEKASWEIINTPTPTLIPPTNQPQDKTQRLSLAGVWELKLGSYDGAKTLSDSCRLPGTLDENQKGTKNTKTETGKLTRKYTYTGKAVYQKKIDLPADWEGKSVTLLLERTKKTRVWVNGIEQIVCGSNETIAAAQEYELVGWIPGQQNTLAVEVDNSNYSAYFGNGNESRSTKTHMLTEETQTNWNGIIGQIELRATDPVYMKDILVYPDVEKKTAQVKIVIKKDIEERARGKITLHATSYNCADGGDAALPVEHTVELSAGKGEQTLEYTYNMGENVKLWSEFHPTMYQLVADMTLENGNTSNYLTSFGMREFSTDGTKFTINGNKTFLRGEANSAVFPLTGYPYMTKEEWITFFQKAQDLGINFFRFHSWTPPEAAFEAADELGIYMQPELYGFGGTPDFSGYFKEEAERILKYYANHPSFVMFAWGNEMSIDGTAAETGVNTLRAFCRELDPTRLYSEGTNNDFNNAKFNSGDDFWTTAKVGKSEPGENPDQYNVRMTFAWNNAASGGFLEAMQPNSQTDYSQALSDSKMTQPVIGHEVGQYQVIPNFKKEIPKYEDGIFSPKNLVKFQETMKSKGLLEMNEKFSQATARSSAIQYRAEIEAALRTPGFGGYELLSIQDFPGQDTALVGILDSFMEEKEGGFTKAEYKSFNSPVTVLAKLPKYMYSVSDAFMADIILTNYGEADIHNVNGGWELRRSDGTVLKSGMLEPGNAPQGTVLDLGSVREENIFSSLTKAEKLVFEVKAAGSVNQYSVWVYPDRQQEVPEGVLVADAYTKEVRDTLEAGGKVLMLPEPNESNLPNSVSVRWTNDFWSTMFHGRVAGAAHTVGLYVEEQHPVFQEFPTEFFGDYQWYNLMKNSRAVILDGAPAELTPMAQNIDHMKYSRKLGSIFEAKVGEGSLLVCTMDILNQMNQYPEVKQMYNSLLEYAGSTAFHPETELTPDYLRTIFKPVINSDGEVSAYEPMSGFDYSWSRSKSNFKNQSGMDENNNKVSNAVGGISAGDVVKYDNILFGEKGADQLMISGANASSSSTKAVIDIYIGSVYGPKLTTVEFDLTGGWDKFKTQVFDIPHLDGKQDLVFQFTNANICLNNICFKESQTKYKSPYDTMDPSDTGTGSVEITDIGGSHGVEQLTVKVEGQVRFSFPGRNFGINGASKVILGGCALSEDGTVQANLVYLEQGQRKTIPLTFKNNEGESYTLESGTTAGLTFWRNTIDLPAEISGLQELAIEFKEGTNLEFSEISFAQGQVGAVGSVAFGRVFYARDTEAGDRMGEGITADRSSPDEVLSGMAPPNDILQFTGIDFGNRGANKITICGANGSDTLVPAELRIWYSSTDYVDLVFEATGGTGAVYDKEASVALPDIKGVHDIRIQFMSGSMSLNYIRFTENTSASVTAQQWDLTSIVQEKTVMDKFENNIVDFDGLTIKGAGGSDYISPSEGVHFNGASKVENGMSSRYIELVPKADGTLRITAKRSYSNGKLCVANSSVFTGGKEISGLADNSSWATGEIPVIGGLTYYLYCGESGMKIQSIEFVPAA